MKWNPKLKWKPRKFKESKFLNQDKFKGEKTFVDYNSKNLNNSNSPT